MTSAELRTMLINRKVQALRDTVAFADIAGGVSALDASQKDALVTAARAGDATGLGTLVLQATAQKLKTTATTAVDAALADGSLSLAELQALFP